jgi:hypothetical protein
MDPFWKGYWIGVAVMWVTGLLFDLYMMRRK